MSPEPPVLITRSRGVVRAIFNRPDKRNAMNLPLVTEMDRLLAELARDPATRILVLSGAGGHFCAGLDLSEAATPQSPEEKLAGQLKRNRSAAARFRAVAELPQIVIAAVEGTAYAGGLGWVCAADIVLASQSARFAAPEVLRGLLPAQILPWLVLRAGRSVAARMVLTGSPLTAEEAFRVRLVDVLAESASDLEANLDSMITQLLKAAPEAVAETKKLLRGLGGAFPPSYAEDAAAAFSRQASGREAAEGLLAFKERRRPDWMPSTGGTAE